MDVIAKKGRRFWQRRRGEPPKVTADETCLLTFWPGFVIEQEPRYRIGTDEPMRPSFGLGPLADEVIPWVSPRYVPVQREGEA